MSDVNPLSIVGLLLTLASIIGTFFYLQLSQWLRDLLALDQKVLLSRDLSTPDQQDRVQFESRVELKRLDNVPTTIVNGTVIAFVVFVWVLSIAMIQSASADPSFGFVLAGLIGFISVFGALVWVLLTQGLACVRRLRAALG
ncbi:hypothetical protein [Microbacterium sp. RU33B]|uniref:hypothetical protein n=1 Tax=Microbacterium sp. RU33B TaxID=1907390 RepID=UPI00095A2D78|nr:hypothetical protein [Microbacterium sp. RU33B]SIT77242.1 hypothetical protein SAMN05880545_1718 [Microbacterium sp. RU33B]